MTITRNDLTVPVRVRFIAWAQFVLRTVSIVVRLPWIGLPLARLVYLAAWFQIRVGSPVGHLVNTPWKWMRVPFPQVTYHRNKKVSA